jgi:hypothetical protein
MSRVDPVRSIVLALTAALALSGSQAGAKEVAAAQRPLAELEEIFWECDYASAQVMLDAATAVACVAAIGELRRRKFEGDLDAMLAWWQRNKARHHARLDAGYRSGASR